METNEELWSERFESAADSLQLERSEYSSILSAINRSRSIVTKARLATRPLTVESASLVAFGSLARHELTPASDFDYLMTTDSTLDNYEPLMDQAVEKIRESLGETATLPPPGRSGIFGKCVPIGEIVSNIGLQGDTNHNLTRRILLLEESVALSNTALHTRSLERIFNRYFEARSTRNSTKVPRVLLNDIVRYWRTITIDYHAKTSPGKRYSLRYLKLLFSRKLCYISSLEPLCWIEADSLTPTAQGLAQSFSTPSIVRLAEFLCKSSQRGSDVELNSSRIVLTSYAKYLDLMGDPQWRASVSQELEKSGASTDFMKLRDAGKKMHEHITHLLTSPAIIEFTKNYMLA